MGRVWLGANQRLEQTEQKRVRYQQAFAADAISLADLKARNAELEQDERIARGELERLWRGSKEIADLEKWVLYNLEHFGLCEPNPAIFELLHSDPLERHKLYKSLGLRVWSYPDGTTEIALENLLGGAGCLYERTDIRGVNEGKREGRGQAAPAPSGR